MMGVARRTEAVAVVACLATLALAALLAPFIMPASASALHHGGLPYSSDPPPPTVTSVSPASGTTAGGTSVTIKGSGFLAGATVTIGNAATSVTVVSAKKIKATTAATVAGSDEVVVTDPNGTSTGGPSYTYIAPPPPAVTRVSPASGTTAGGTSVTIKGSGFLAGATVTIGNAATSVRVVSAKKIKATTAATVAGSDEVVVTDSNGTSTGGPSYTYIAPPAPTVTSVSPNSGSVDGGSAVTIEGTNLTAASVVEFGAGNDATNVQVVSASKIVAVSPAVSTLGAVAVAVMTPSGTSSRTLDPADQFTYIAPPAPTVTNVSPSSGSVDGGSAVAIEGMNLSGASVVEFGPMNYATSIQVVSASKLIVVAPAASSPVAVAVSVTTPAGSSSTTLDTADEFTYVSAPAPTVSNVAPAVGSVDGGGAVAVEGTNLSGASVVEFGPGNDAAGIQVVSASKLIVVAPAATGVGPVAVSVTTPAGSSSTTLDSADEFTYVSAPAPTVTNVSPDSGSVEGGTAVAVEGTNLSGASVVEFGPGNDATGIQVVSASKLIVVAPAASSVGAVAVFVTTPAGSSSSALAPADEYVYGAAPLPAVTNVSPHSGSVEGGTAVAVEGTNLSGASVVEFGPMNYATGIQVVSPSKIIVVAPAASSPAPVAVVVTTPAGSSSSALAPADQYVYGAAPLPAVTNVSPSSGSVEGGTAVAVEGTNLSGASVVEFGPGNDATGIQVVSSSKLVMVAPAASTAGAVAVVVRTPAGSSSSVLAAADEYAYSAPPVPAVTNVSPNSGSVEGGTAVAVEGTNLSGASAVEFGAGDDSTSVEVVSANKLIVVAPAASSAGTVAVVVRTSVGSSSATRDTADEFTYLSPPAPIVTNVSPNSGSVEGGTAVAIEGTNLSGAWVVEFGPMNYAAGIQVVSASKIIVVAPAASSPVPVAVVVSTPAGSSSTTLDTADQYTYTSPPVPTVTNVSPGSGSVEGGTAVAVEGTNLSGASVVEFGPGNDATGVHAVSSSKVVVVAPAASSAGAVAVVVGTPAGSSSTMVDAADQYTYTSPPLPTVTNVSPDSGSVDGGAAVAVEGTNLSGASVVEFGPGNDATGIQVVSSSKVVVVAPAASSAGVVAVVVRTPAGSSSATLATADEYVYSAPPLPAVTNVSPDSGSVEGGTAVAVEGTNLSGASVLEFGPGDDSTSIQVVSASKIIAVAPAASSPAPVAVVVRTPAGSSSATRDTADEFTYLLPPAPMVTNVSPNSGSVAGGTPVVIEGTNLTSITGAAPTVAFGGVIVPPTQILSITSSKVIVVSAAVPTLGPVAVVVMTPAGSSSMTLNAANQFTYTPPVPTVTSVSPTSGPVPGATKVTIEGTNFPTAASALEVNFGAVSVPQQQIQSVTGTKIVLTAPPPAGGATGTVDVTVTNEACPGCSVTSAKSAADEFTYLSAGTPVVTSVSPMSGPVPGGTKVTIEGTNLPTTAALAVDFGSITVPPGLITSASATNIVLTAPPAMDAGTVDVTVTNQACPGCTSPISVADRFTYVSAGTPVVTSVSPTSGSVAGGSKVTIEGTNFPTTAALAVDFGSIAVPPGLIASASATKIVLTSPAAVRAGTVDVTVTNGGCSGCTSPISAADQFTYTALPGTPVVTSILPTSGPVAGGTPVAIEGTNLTTGAQPPGVEFGSKRVPPAGILSATSTTQVIVLAPAATTAGPVDVTVTTDACPQCTSAKSAADQYTYTSPPAPTVTNVAPDSGSVDGGNAVAVEGTNLSGASVVEFGPMSYATSIQVVSASKIIAVAPAASSPVPVAVVVSTPAGSSSTTLDAADQYTYTSPPVPTVTNVAPNSGSVDGGAAVAVEGTNLSGASVVEFGPGNDATGVHVVSSSKVVVVAPAASSPVPVAVVVSTPAGTSSSTLDTADQYTYASSPVPTVTNVAPDSGSVDGGNAVAVEGTNLSGASVVEFGPMNYAASIQVVSSSKIIAVAPAASSPVPVAVVVSTPAGTSSTTLDTADRYTYLAPPLPTVTNVAPDSGSVDGGAAVAVEGTNLSGASVVEFGPGNDATSVHVVSSSKVVVVAPAASSAGAVAVVVTTPAGSSSSTLDTADQYTYTSPPAPTVTNVAPDSGSVDGGNAVAVEGTNLSGASVVEFGPMSYATSIQVVSSSKIIAVAPAASGPIPVAVVVGTPAGSSSSTLDAADQYTYTSPPVPTVTNVAPVSGSVDGGNAVAVEGANLSGASVVEFGPGNDATSVQVVSSGKVVVVAPAGSSAGAVAVVVTTPAGSSSTTLDVADRYTYTSPPVPTVTSVSPNSGPVAGGNAVAVEGTNLSGASTVEFGAGNDGTSIQVVSSSRIIVVAPAASASGAVAVVVSTPAGSSSTSLDTADQYTYVGFSIEKLQEIAGSGAGFTTSSLTGNVGQTVDYEIIVKNTGTVPLMYSASDPNCGTSWGESTEAPGSTVTFTCDHVLNAVGSYSNTATNTGTPPVGEGSPSTLTSNTVVVNVPSESSAGLGRCVKATGGTGQYKDSACETTEVGGRFEWFPGAVKNKFTSREGATELESASGQKIRCAGGSDAGEYVGTAEVLETITFTGCEGSGVKCKQGVQPEGTVETALLRSVGGLIKQPADIGVSLESASGGVFAEFMCSGVRIAINGSVIAPITPISRMTTIFTEKFDAAGSKQEPESFEGGPREVLETSFGNPFEDSVLRSTETITNEEKLEIKEAH